MSVTVDPEVLSLLTVLFSWVVLGFAGLLIIRRVLLTPRLAGERRLARRWTRELDTLAVSSAEPAAGATAAFRPTDRRSRHLLERLLTERLDVLDGRSLLPLTRVFERSGLLQACLREANSRRRWVRRRAIDLLGRSRSRRGILTLLLALRDDDQDVRTLAVKGLGDLGVSSAAPFMVSLIPDLSEDRCIVVTDTLIDIGAGAVPALSDALEHEAEHVRYFSATAMGHILARGVPMRTETIEERLMALTWDESERVRLMAVRGLAEAGCRAAADRFDAMLSDGSWRVREAAAHGLGRLGAVAKAPQLVYALADPAWEVSRAAARSLAPFGAAWLELLDDPELDGTGAHAWREEIVQIAEELAS